jgi:hypothetical protein
MSIGVFIDYYRQAYGILHREYNVKADGRQHIRIITGRMIGVYIESITNRHIGVYVDSITGRLVGVYIASIIGCLYAYVWTVLWDSD